MKIIVLLFAAFCAFGLATKEAVSVKTTQQKAVASHSVVEVEASAMDVLLDTVEIAVNSQDLIAGI